MQYSFTLGVTARNAMLRSLSKDCNAEKINEGFTAIP
jgi:hypothetical protein